VFAGISDFYQKNHYNAEMKKNGIPKKTRAVFFRYIIIFSLFAVILFMLFMPMYMYILNYTRTNALSSIRDRLNSGVTVIDSTVAVLNSMVLFTTQDSRFRSVNDEFPNAETNPLALSELRSVFSRFILLQPLIADAGIIFSGDIILTTSHLFYYTEYFLYYQFMFRCENMSWHEWNRFLMTNMPIGIVKDYWSSRTGSYQALTFSANWIDARGNPCQIFATLPTESLLTLAADNETIKAGIVRIYSGSGVLLYESDRSEGKFCNITRVESSQTSLIYEVGVPDSIINERVKPVRNLILLIAMVTAATGIVLSLVFAERSSTPMRKFFASLDSMKNIENKNMGIFQSLGKIYTDLAANINVMDEKLESSLKIIENQTRILRNQIFDRAINQGVYDTREAELFLSMFPDFPEQYQLGVIHYEPVTDLQNTAAIQITLINMVKNQLDNVYIQGVSESTIALLLPVNQGFDWYRMLQSLRNELSRISELSLTYGLSGIFDKPSDLVHAWNQLQLIHMTAGINDLTGVQDIRDFPVSKINFPLDINMFQMIYNALSNGNEVTACAILKERWDASALTDEKSFTELFYQLLKITLMLLKMRYPSLLYDVEIPVYGGENRSELFNKQFPECFKQTAFKIKNARQNSINEFGEKIMDFINEHLFDPALYIKMVSDQFNISAPTLQKIIRPFTGKTFLAYVEDKRLEKARDMIASGKFTVTESARASGFSNKNSFYIAFKKAYGFPPGEILGKKNN